MGVLEENVEFYNINFYFLFFVISLYLVMFDNEWLEEEICGIKMVFMGFFVGIGDFLL